MKHLFSSSITIISILYAVNLFGQDCFNCPNLIKNGSFESTNNSCPDPPFNIDVDVWNGISSGCMNNWQCGWGTADFFIPGGSTWYNTPSEYQSNVAHITYGKIISNSEAFYQEVEIYSDSDLTYCGKLDVSSGCFLSTNTPGQLVVKLGADNVGCYNQALFKTFGQDVLIEEVGWMGLKEISFEFTPVQDFQRIYIASNTNVVVKDITNWCGLEVDDVELHCKTNALNSIQSEITSNGCFQFSPIFEPMIDVTVSEWTINGTIVATDQSSITECLDAEIINEVCYFLEDSRGCCAQKCLEIVPEIDVNTFRHCMDCGESGYQVIESIETSAGNFPGGAQYNVPNIFDTDFIDDFNSWLASNGLGQASLKIIENTIEDECRGPWIFVENTSLDFLSISYDQLLPNSGNGNTCEFEKI